MVRVVIRCPAAECCREFAREAVASMFASPMVSKRVICHPVEPQQRRIDSHIIQSAPEDEEYLARHVCGIIRTDSPLQITQDGGIVLPEQRVEPILACHWPTCISVQFRV
jgi:aspartate carbamoyltransferase regulatory subunit